MGRLGQRKGAVLFVVCFLFLEKFDHINNRTYKSHGEKIEGARMKRQSRISIWEERRRGGRPDRS